MTLRKHVTKYKHMRKWIFDDVGVVVMLIFIELTGCAQSINREVYGIRNSPFTYIGVAEFPNYNQIRKYSKYFYVFLLKFKVYEHI